MTATESSSGRVWIQVMDISGQAVRRQDLGDLSAGLYAQALDLGSLASGIYLVQLGQQTSTGPRSLGVFKWALVR